MSTTTTKPASEFRNWGYPFQFVSVAIVEKQENI